MLDKVVKTTKEMDITALKTFLEVAKVKHFGRAADNLCVTQSAVSARVKSLEDALGVELIIRERANIHLSPDGEALMPFARNIVSNWEQATQTLKMQSGVKKQLAIGGLPGIWDMLLQPWLSKTILTMPELAITAEVLSEDSLLERLATRSLDLAFVYDAPRGKYLTSQKFAKIALVLVSSEKNQSAVQALQSNYTLVDWGANFAVQHAKHYPDAPFARLKTTQGRLAYEQLKSRGGAAYLARPMVEKAIKTKELFLVKDAPEFKRAAYAVFHQRTEKSQLIQKLLIER